MTCLKYCCLSQGPISWVFRTILHLQEAKNKLLRFMNAAYNPQDIGTLHNDLRDLKATVAHALSPFVLTTGPDVNEAILSLPDKLFPNYAVFLDCLDMVGDGLSTPNFTANAEELLAITDANDFNSKFLEFSYLSFADDIEDFEDAFVKCGSYYKNYVNDLSNFADTLTSFSETDVTTGIEFIFEKESKVRSVHIDTRVRI